MLYLVDVFRGGVQRSGVRHSPDALHVRLSWSQQWPANVLHLRAMTESLVPCFPVLGTQLFILI